MTDIEKALNYHRSGQLEEARLIYSKLLNQNPDNADVLNLYGVLKMQQGRYDEAQSLLLHAFEISASPVFADNLGLVCYLKKQYKDAAKYFEIALEKEFFKDSALKLIDSLKRTGQFFLALKYLKILYEHDNENIGLIREIAQLAGSCGDLQTAAVFYKKSLKLEPADCVGENNLGLIYEKLSNPSEAKKCYLLSLKIKNNFEANKNLGILFRKEKNYQKSEEYLKKALSLKPDDEKTHTSLGMTYLAQKKFSDGYKHYILKNPDIKKQYKNHWDGSIHGNAHILVFCDGGYGDFIMFSRYVLNLREIFAKITLLVPPELERLFKENFKFADVRAGKDGIDYDFSVSVMDLPYFLGLDFKNIPAAHGYMDAAACEKNGLFNTDKLKAGLFWHGNQRVHKNRSIDFERLETLFSKNVQYYSFQIDEEQKKTHENIISLASHITDFYDTACAMKNLDLMITTDSACVHLAGALGVKTFLLLPAIAEWRWFDDDFGTPWYNSVRLFKQSVEGDWSGVIDRLSKNF